MRRSIKTAILACVFAAAFQITAFASFSWKVENAESSYVGTTNVTVTNTSGKKETEDAPIVKKGTVVTFMPLCGLCRRIGATRCRRILAYHRFPR